MKQPKLSIIVPVYNVEKYLSDCLESILSQDFKDYEIVLLDDGSSDGCPAICDDYAMKDHRIRVFHQQNAGQASVRNAGLTKAKGFYVTFVDSDDILAENALQTLMDDIEKTSSDIVLGRMVRFDENNNFRPYTKLATRRDMSGKEAMCTILEGKLLNISMCGGIYKKSVFYNVSFPEGYVCEDWFVTPSIYLNAKKVVFNPVLSYKYRVNSVSTMAYLSKKPNAQVIEVAEHAIDMIRDSEDEQLYYNTLWFNIRRVWKFIGIMYSKGMQSENRYFEDKVQDFIRGYWKDLKLSKQMNKIEQIGVWSFCFCKPVFRILRHLKNN